MFVDKPEATATVRLDMNQSFGGNKVVLNFGRKFDISSPPLKQSFATNSMIDGGRLNSSAFENRNLQFSVTLQGTLQEKASNLAKLNRELGRPQNLIMYTPKASEIAPIFFRTFRSDQYTFVSRTEKGPWHVDCQVVAEPCAIGEMLHPIQAVATSNDPAAVSNGQHLDFPDIIGDCPSPAYAYIHFEPALSPKDAFYLSSRTHHNSSFHHARQFVSGDAGADTVAASGADFSGGGGLVTNFATSNADVVDRVTFNSSQIADVYTVRGRYRVLVRMRFTGTSDNMALRLQDQRFSIEDVYSKLLTVVPFVEDDWDDWTHMDFGVVSHPPYQTPNEFGYSGQPPGVGGIDTSFQAQRVTGSGSLYTDYAAFLPADESMLIASPQQSGQSHLILDGPNEMVYGMWEGSPFDKTKTFWYYLYQGTGPIPWRGSIPDLVPGAPNSWYFLQRRGDITDQMTFDVYYWPKWLEVATP